MRLLRVVLSVAVVASLAGCSTPPSPPVSISLTPSASQAIDQNASVPVSATVTNDRSSKGVSWSLTGPGSINLSTGPSITYSAPTTRLTSPQQATVTATSLADSTKTASLLITVNPLPVIPNQTLAGGTVGVPFSQTIALTGGTAPFQWSVYNGPILTGYKVGGSIPDGLALNPATGAITGTPTAAGTWYFEAAVIDADNADAENGFMSIQINPAAPAAANPVPFLNQSLTPASVAPGSGALTLSLSGSGFRSGSTIDFNGTPRPTTFIDAEHLSASLPASDVATAGTASITAVNPSPGGGSSNVAFFPVGAQHTAVSFANAPNSPLQIKAPYGLAVADLNQDGHPDLAIAAAISLSVLLSKGDGTFTSAPGSPISILSPPYSDFATPYVGPIAVGDFNHSRHPGLAVGLISNMAAAILLGNGDGTLAPSSAGFADTAGQPTSALQAADFNADGNLDLAIANQLTGVSPVALGYGAGAFNMAGDLYPQISAFPSGVAVGDFNGDGKLDAAVTSGGSATDPYSRVAISLGNGDGTFTQANGSPLPLGQSLSAVAAADFNGDGKLDLAISDYSGNSVFILLGNGDGTFKPPTSFSVGNAPESLVAGDFNNDGKLDLAIANYNDATVTLLLGNGDGTFTQASGSPFPVGKGPTSIVAADFDSDGKLDLATTNNLDGKGSVSILLQQ